MEGVCKGKHTIYKNYLFFVLLETFDGQFIMWIIKSFIADKYSEIIFLKKFVISIILVHNLYRKYHNQYLLPTIKTRQAYFHVYSVIVVLYCLSMQAILRKWKHFHQVNGPVWNITGYATDIVHIFYLPY